MRAEDTMLGSEIKGESKEEGHVLKASI